MSVLNRMLQDLEARRATGNGVDGAVRATAARPTPRRLLLCLVAGAVAAFGLAFGDWPMLLSANAARTPQPVAVVEPASTEPVAATREAVKVQPAAAEAETAAVAAAQAAPQAAPASRHAAPRRETRARSALEPEPAAYMAHLSMTAVPNRFAAPAPLAGPAAAAAALAGPAAAPAPAPAAAAAAASATSAASSAQAVAPMQAFAPARADSTGPGRVDKQMSLPSATQRAQALYRHGLELAASGQGRQGVQRLQEALQIDPKLHAARLQAVALLFEQGRGPEAEALAREGLLLVPDDAALGYLLARGMAGQGDTAGALALLERSPRLSADAFGLRAGLYSQQGDFKRALPDYEQAVRLQPANSLWWLGLGVALEADGQRKQARQVYARAQGIGVDSHELNVFLDQKLRALQ